MAVERPPKDLHLVSQTLLRSFSVGGFLTSLDVRWPAQRPRLRPVSRLAFRDDLVPSNPDEFESLWQTMEVAYPRARAAVADGTIFESERLLDVVRDCLAVHFARSNTVARIVTIATEGVLNRLEQRLVEGQLLESPSGLAAAGPEGQALIAKQYTEQARTELFDPVSTIPERMMENFTIARERIASQPIEIVVAAEGEFLIGDTPAHTLSSDNRIDVLWDQANTVTMPLDRHYAFALGPKNRYIEFDKNMVNFINRVQVQTAQKFVMWHPNAQMVNFVREVLD